MDLRALYIEVERLNIDLPFNILVTLLKGPKNTKLDFDGALRGMLPV